MNTPVTTPFLNKFLAIIFTVLAMFSSAAHAADFEGDQGVTIEELRVSIAKNTTLNADQINMLIQTLTEQFQTPPNQRIPIKGYLYAHGLNGAFFVDHDTWIFDAMIQDPATNELVKIPKMFLCDFHNGGLKFEVAYKWMFSFIPLGVNVNELHGATYGRGIGVVGEALLGLEGSWLPSNETAHDLFHVAIKLGFGAGIVFPKMEFKLRKMTGAVTL